LDAELRKNQSTEGQILKICSNSILLIKAAVLSSTGASKEFLQYHNFDPNIATYLSCQRSNSFDGAFFSNSVADF
jgi:hypothetical protein